MMKLIESLESRRMFSGAPSIGSLTLVNAAANQPIAGYTSLSEGTTLNLATLPTRLLSIQANPTSAPGSIRFGLDGNASFRTESFAPYMLAGDDTKGDIYNWTPTVGSHTLTATSFSESLGQGTAGTPYVLHFTVIDSNVASPSPSPSPSPTPAPTPAPTPPPQNLSGYFVPQPVAGGKTITVDPNGSVKTIGQAAQLALPGDVVVIKPGRYYESIKLTRSGTSSAPITFAAESLGSVTIDGTGKSIILDGGGVSYIHIQGMTFDHCNNPLEEAAVRVASYWNVSDVVVQNVQAQGMMVYGTGATLTRVTAQSNGQEGLGGASCKYVTVTNCITRWNNPGLANPSWAGMVDTEQVNGLWYVKPDFESGAGKWSQVDHVTLDGVQSYANHGTGIWFDYNNTNVIIRNCNVHDNVPVKYFYEGVGISIEVSNQGPILIENNTVSNNCGGEILLTSSRNVTVRNNTITGFYIALNDWDRGANYTLENCSFTGNRFNDCYYWTGGSNWYSNSAATKNLTFDYNTYAPSSGGYLARWGTSDYKSITLLRSGLNIEWHGTQV